MGRVAASAGAPARSVRFAPDALGASGGRQGQVLV